MNILEEANKITSQGRNLEYGESEDNFARIWAYNKAFLYNKALMQDITDHEKNVLLTFIDTLGIEYIAMQGMFIKLGREDFNHKEDNLIDLVGYARCLSKIKGDENV